MSLINQKKGRSKKKQRNISFFKEIRNVWMIQKSVYIKNIFNQSFLSTHLYIISPFHIESDQCHCLPFKCIYERRILCICAVVKFAVFCINLINICFLCWERLTFFFNCMSFQFLSWTSCTYWRTTTETILLKEKQIMNLSHFYCNITSSK